MEQGKRKEYFIFTSIFWWMGFILFGVMMVNKEVLDIPLSTFTVFLLYGLEGGLLLGGLVSGMILFVRFFKRQKLVVRVMLCLFFPVTFAVVCHIGILLFLPYGIYNFVAIKKNKIEKVA